MRQRFFLKWFVGAIQQAKLYFLNFKSIRLQNEFTLVSKKEPMLRLFLCCFDSFAAGVMVKETF